MKKIAAPILEISNLCKKEKNTTIDRLNIILPIGESMAVLYKNDAAIELLCDILKGVKKSDKGKVFFKSNDVTGVKNNFGVVHKNPDIPKTKSVSDFAAAPVVKRGLSRKMASALIQKELSAFELSDYGEKTVSLLPDNLIKRAAVFNAYMCSHELLVIDEPYANLESEVRESELKLLENVKNNSKLSMLMFTKSIDLGLRFADTVMVVDSNTCSAGIISVDRRKIDLTAAKIKELYDSI